MGSTCEAGTDEPSQKDVKRVGNGIVENGHSLKAEEEKWGDGTGEDLPDGHSTPPEPQQTDEQKEHQVRIVRWERFLPVKTLRVLLVENDDSTRQVVSALLRKCSYEVIPAENGLHAWQCLEDLQNHIDLVLTEVVMPHLSGIGLLNKITSHKICKDIPVIMMSSNDSMSTVFKCLSKGAVDFLVKPIRKNELKNLWQHVWRRCHSSSGSGSESGIRTQKCTKPKVDDEYENNSGSNHDGDADDNDEDDDDFSVGLNARDGSDNGSGTQSSWTKRAVEIDSPQQMSPDQPSDPADSTCAQVIHPKSEICSNRWLPTANKRSGKKQKENNDDSMGKYLEIGAPRNCSVEYQSSPNEMSVNPTEIQHETLMPQIKSKNKTMREKDSRNTQNEPTTQTVDLISSIARNTEDKQVGRITNAPDCTSKVPDGNDKSRDSLIDMTSEELGLKRLKTAGSANEINDERNILKRSDLSAFTRYHTTVASNQGGAGYGGSCSPQDNSSEALKTDSNCKVKSNSDAAAIKQGSNGSSNNNDMGSSTKNVITKPSSNRGKVILPSAVKATQHTSAFHPVQRQSSPANVIGKDKVDEGIANAVNVGHPGDVQHSFMQHHHHVHYYVHVMTQQQQQPSIEHGLSDAQCGSSNVFDPPIEGHAANYSMNGSISGGHNGSNGQGGASTAPNVGRPNMESANGTMDENGAGGGNGSGSGSGNDMYQSGVCYREAALNKFRQKRKVRNFGKKVRYQSRKRLAEQRPRVRGQFVRQSGQDDQAGQEEDR
ncbi:two-component response regulator-like PRR73 [Oryza brachyantha]|uniref:Pseudo-response regulator n=1 Tax=Oryza brachyantha TaxID=4533 RepID=J3LMN0_ORYBR|nr:two-component response regulator-like PRR73 [Oryza brachyantha]XP_006649885.1 two-component response regulator-like PRR73 [Oryza brachyantha]XP_015690730.1 two-component response regulator-like PRR73 [Oryza brachyantha]